MQNPSSKQLPISDLHLATYLNLHGIEPELSLQGGRVVFLFTPDENFFRLTDAFNANTKVRVLDFCTALRRLKAKMLSEKDRGVNLNREELSNANFQR